MIRLLKRWIGNMIFQIGCDRNFIGYRQAVYTINVWIYGQLTCELCKLGFGKTTKKTLDHIIPKSKGGSFKLNNLQLAHRWCNGQKGDKLPI